MPTVLYDSDFTRADGMMIGPMSSLRHVIAECIAMERERCAAVVENMGRANGRVRAPHKRIAAEIRAGAKPRIGKIR